MWPFLSQNGKESSWELGRAGISFSEANGCTGEELSQEGRRGVVDSVATNSVLSTSWAGILKFLHPPRFWSPHLTYLPKLLPLPFSHYYRLDSGPSQFSTEQFTVPFQSLPLLLLLIPCDCISGGLSDPLCRILQRLVHFCAQV